MSSINIFQYWKVKLPSLLKPGTRSTKVAAPSHRMSVRRYRNWCPRVSKWCAMYMQLLWWMAASWGSFWRFSLSQEGGRATEEMYLFRPGSVKKIVTPTPEELRVEKSLSVTPQCSLTGLYCFLFYRKNIRKNLSIRPGVKGQWLDPNTTITNSNYLLGQESANSNSPAPILQHVWLNNIPRVLFFGH